MKNISPEEIKIIYLSTSRQTHWRDDLPIKIRGLSNLNIELDCQDWVLSYKDVKELINILGRNELRVNRVRSISPETLVSSSALGLGTHLTLSKADEDINIRTSSRSLENDPSLKLLFHQGTLRSGESLSGEGDILLLGDVNPGAKITAGGDVLIWGRLLGIAHAGKNGNINSRIIALELRPLQLRIATEIARGPEGKPEPGLAEEAHFANGKIVIKPARTGFLKT